MMENPQAKVGRGSDQFPLRLPDGMRQRIKEAADKAGRSMNAEVVRRLDNFDLLLLDRTDANDRIKKLEADQEISALALDFAREKIERLEGDLAAKEVELAVAHRATDEALNRTTVLDQMYEMMGNVSRELTTGQRADLLEVTSVIKFLEADAVCLRAEIDGESVIPRAEPPIITSSLAERLVRACDRRNWLFAQAMFWRFDASTFKHETPARALALAHQIDLPDGQREIAELYLSDADTKSTPPDSSAFLDLAGASISSMPEELQRSAEDALSQMMPRLFRGWKRNV